MKIYVVKMNRWGNTEDGHSYIEGVYTKLALAKRNGKKEQLNRDNKYEPEIIPLELDQSKQARVNLAKKNRTPQMKEAIKKRIETLRHTHFPVKKKKKNLV